MAALFSKRPLLIASQQTAAQSIPGSTITPVTMDTEYLDSWNGHVTGAAVYTAPFAGWYLCEGNVFITGTSTSCNYGAGIQITQNSATSTLFGGFLCANGVNTTGPAVTDLVQLFSNTADTVSLIAYQTSGGSPDLATPGAFFKVEWVGLPSVIGAGYTGLLGDTAPDFSPAAPWPPGNGTQITNSGGIAAGATSLTVASATGIVVGGTLGLEYYSGYAVQAYAETVTVTSVTGTTIGISAAIYPHAQNAPVAVPVSAAFLDRQLSDNVNYLGYPAMCRLHNKGTSQTVTSQTMPTATAVTFGGATLDNYSGWNGTTEYVFPFSGVYDVYGQAFLAPLQAGNISAGIGITGGTIQWGDSMRCQTNTLSACPSVRKLMRVQAGDYAQLFVAQNSGGTIALDGTSDAYSTLICVWRGF